MRSLSAACVSLALACTSRTIAPKPKAPPSPIASVSAKTPRAVRGRDPVYSFTLGIPDSVALPCAVPYRESDIAWKTNGDLSVQLPASEVLDTVQRKRLANGIAISIAVRVYAFPRPADTPISVAARTCRLTYDLWNDVYVMVANLGSTQVSKTSSASLRHSFRACFADLRVANRAAIGTTSTVLGVIVDVDPPPLLRTEIAMIVKAGYGPPPASAVVGGTFRSLFCGQSTALRFRTQLVIP